MSSYSFHTKRSTPRLKLPWGVGGRYKHLKEEDNVQRQNRDFIIEQQLSLRDNFRSL